MHLKSALLVSLSAIAVASLPAGGAESTLQPLLLFMEPTDARDAVGLLEFEANPLERHGAITAVGSDPATSAPARHGGRGGRGGIDFRPLIAVPQADGSAMVFGCDSVEGNTEPRTFLWRLYRTRTPDGYHYTQVEEVYRNPEGPWLIEASMVRQDSTGRLFFYPWSRSVEPAKGHALWGFVSDDGEAWRPLSDRPVYLDHDAFGMMWDIRTNRFLTGQVTNQPWKKQYPDNMGGEKRRVLNMRTSRDGIAWEPIGNTASNGLILPDDKDSADVEFYRMQPFAYGDRYIAMADLYAAWPLTPNKHGPHLTCEWWVSSDGIHWRRPWRSVAAHGDAPYPVKMAPMWFGREMLFWLPGEVHGLREYRIASIGSRSNAEFSSAVFTMLQRPLLLNASVPEGQGLFKQSYVQVELRDEQNRVVPGYERDKCLLQGVDDTRISLRWGDRTGQELDGRKVALRFYLRSARIYAVGVER